MVKSDGARRTKSGRGKTIKRIKRKTSHSKRVKRSRTKRNKRTKRIKKKTNKSRISYIKKTRKNKSRKNKRQKGGSKDSFTKEEAAELTPGKGAGGRTRRMRLDWKQIKIGGVTTDTHHLNNYVGIKQYTGSRMWKPGIIIGYTDETKDKTITIELKVRHPTINQVSVNSSKTNLSPPEDWIKEVGGYGYGGAAGGAAPEIVTTFILEIDLSQVEQKRDSWPAYIYFTLGWTDNYKEQGKKIKTGKDTFGIYFEKKMGPVTMFQPDLQQGVPALSEETLGAIVDLPVQQQVHAKPALLGDVPDAGPEFLAAIAAGNAAAPPPAAVSQPGSAAVAPAHGLFAGVVDDGTSLSAAGARARARVGARSQSQPEPKY